MCESTVFLKERSGLTSVMVDAVRVAVNGTVTACTDLAGLSVSLDGVRVTEIDLLRHRVILERA
jgi:predicted RNA-binding protein